MSPQYALRPVTHDLLRTVKQRKAQPHAMFSKCQRTDEKPAETMNAENKFPFTLTSCTSK